MRTPEPTETSVNSQAQNGDNQSAAKPRRFSLRTMLVLVTAIACLMGWASRKIHRARAQRSSVEKLLKQGNLKLGYDWQTKDGSEPQPQPQWIIDKVGEEYFQEVTSVYLALHDENQIDLRPLSEFTELQTVSIDNRSPDVHAQLRKDVLSPLSNLQHLTNVSLAFVNIRDVTSLGKMHWLEKLSIYSHEVDLTPLRNLTKLKRLRLSLDSIDDLSALKNMHSLEHLSLQCHNGANVNLSPIRELTALRELHLEEMQTNGVRALSGLKQLVELVLRVHPETDLAPLASLESLRTLRIYTTNTKTDNLDFVAGLSNLEELDLVGFQCKNFSSLSQLTRLRALSLTRINAMDWSAMVEFPELQTLALDTCNIPDIVPLSSLPNLVRLNLHSMSRDEWNDDQIKLLQEARPNCKIIR